MILTTKETQGCTERDSLRQMNMISCLILVIVCVGKGVVSETPILTPVTVEVIENKSVVLTCTLRGSSMGKITAWTNSETGAWAYMIMLDNGTCDATGFILLNESLYSRSCNRNNTFTLTILKVDETQHGLRWKCRAGFTASNEVIIKVKVPVKSVKITSPISSVATSEENRNCSFTCETSYSWPTPSVKWFLLSAGKTIQINATTADILTSNEKMSESVKNVLTRSFKREINGADIFCQGSNGIGAEVSSRKIILNVTYPADVGSLIGTSLKEGSTLNITCPVIPGNPMSTVVFWTRKRDSRQWKSSQLIILNVSRADDAVYTCTVFNEMIPTIGHAIKTARNSEFHLNVFYSAEIKLFTVLGKDSSKEVIMINQKEEVAFICSTEANPAADISIRSPQYEHIAVVSSNNTLSHAIRNTSCVNAGEYICSSRNNYTHGHASTSRLILIVRCAPKPSSDSIYGGKISSILHADVTLQFTAREYLDEPDITTFVWFKDNTSVENDNTKFVMSSHGLQSNLSIRNITLTDFGRYELLVSNSVGQYKHLYQLMAKDKPEVPKGFGYMEYSITDSSVTLTWSPGFNGGYPQLFLVIYKIITGQKWQNETIIDTGDIEMKHNLSGLLGMTEYQVKMFARNEEGDSAYTESLQFITKASASTVTESHSSSSLVIVAVTVPSVVIVTICGIIVVVLIYRKSLRQKHDRQTTRTVSTYEELDVNKREGDMYSQLPATYEQLNNDRQDKSMYMEMENVQMERENPDYINIRI